MLMQLLAGTPVFLPLAGAAALVVLSFLGIRLKDELIEGAARAVSTIVCGAALGLLASVGGGPRRLALGHLLGIDVTLVVDRLSAPFLAVAAFLIGVVGYFSVRYLRREAGFQRFFLLYGLFSGGLSLLFLAGNLGALVAGWEFVGVSSVLLIGFYAERTAPARNGAFVFVAYRIADVGLVGAMVGMHLLLKSMSLPFWLGPTAPVAPSASLWIGAALVVAAAGKAAQGPFVAWLPRAMEGPTPSSAVFYGALSVHAGAYLLLRTEPFWGNSPVIRSVLIVLGLSTALYATFVGRTRADAKTFLALAAAAQLGLIFAEIGAGFPRLALWHALGHAMMRAFQFLTAPSSVMYWSVRLRDHTQPSPVRFLSPRLTAWVYRRSLLGLGGTSLPGVPRPAEGNDLQGVESR